MSATKSLHFWLRYCPRQTRPRFHFRFRLNRHGQLRQTGTDWWRMMPAVETKLNLRRCWPMKLDSSSRILRQMCLLHFPGKRTKLKILWGSEIWTSLDLNGQKEVGLQIVQISNGIWNREAQPFEIWTNGHHFVVNHLKSGPKSLDFQWSGFQMVGTIAIVIAKAQPFEIGPFEIRPSKIPDFKYFQISNGRISNPHCIVKCLVIKPPFE